MKRKRYSSYHPFSKEMKFVHSINRVDCGLHLNFYFDSNEPFSFSEYKPNSWSRMILETIQWWFEVTRKKPSKRLFSHIVRTLKSISSVQYNSNSTVSIYLYNDTVCHTKNSFSRNSLMRYLIDQMLNYFERI